MHPVIRILLLAMLVAVPAVGQSTGSGMPPSEVVRGVTFIRYGFLRDSTPIEFCELPDLFGQSGELPVDSKQPPPRYRTLEECANAPQNRRIIPRVAVRGRRVVGDTVVFEGYTDHGWVTLLEEYRFHRPRDARHWVPFYRIVGSIER